MPYSTIMKLVFMGTEKFNGTAGVVHPWARQCTLQACVQTISSAIVNGELKETILNTTANTTVPTIATNMEPIIINSTNGNGSFPIKMEVMLAMRSWYADLFKASSAMRSEFDINKTVITPDTVIVNLTVGISSGTTFFDTDIVQAFYWNYYEYANGIDMLMNDLAVSVSVSFRSIGGVPVPGLALSLESYVHVRWGFVALPVATVVFTALFLGMTMYRSWRTQTRLWKSNVLATLVHGLDHDARKEFEYLDGLIDQQKKAKRVKVQLDEDDGGLLTSGM
jgi:hypothetical protein